MQSWLVGDLDESNLVDPTHDIFVYFVQNATTVSCGGTVSASPRRRASGSLGSHRGPTRAAEHTQSPASTGQSALGQSVPGSGAPGLSQPVQLPNVSTQLSLSGSADGRDRVSGSKKTNRTMIAAPRMLKKSLASVYSSADQMLSKTRIELLAFITFHVISNDRDAAAITQ
jgi:hypothetical protein